jgi:hypothetical protein
LAIASFTSGQVISSIRIVSLTKFPPCQHSAG